MTPSLKSFVEMKLSPISKRVKKFDILGQAEMWLELARTTRHHHRGPVFRAEADLRLPRKILRAVHEDRDIRMAINRLRVKLELEIEKYKTRTDGVFRRRTARRESMR